MSMTQLVNEMMRSGAITDEQQATAIALVEELGRMQAPGDAGWLQRLIIAVGWSVQPPDAAQDCVHLAGAAAAYGGTEVITAISNSRRADVRGSLAAPNDEGWTPAHLAAVGDHVGVLEALARAGTRDPAVQASLGAPEIHGRSPVHLAAQNGHLGAFDALMNSQSPAALASLTTPDNWDRTPAQIAAARGKTDVVAYMAASLDPRVRGSLLVPDGAGLTPAHWAAIEDHPAVTAVLGGSEHPEIRATLQALNAAGMTPSGLAAANLALVRAGEDLGDDLRMEAKNLCNALRCDVLHTPLALAGWERPVHVRGPDGAGAHLKHCLSAKAAQTLVAQQHPVNPVTREPIDRYEEAPRRVALLTQVAHAYEELPRELAREKALEAYAAYEAPHAAPGGAERPQYEVLLGRQQAAPDAGPGAGGPQAG